MSGFVPALFDNTQGDTSNSVQLNQNEITTVQDPLDAILTDKNGTNISISLIDSSTGEKSNTTPQNEGESIELELSAGNVTATYAHDIDRDSALVRFNYPSFYGSNSVPTYFFTGVLGILLIVALLYMLITSMQIEGKL